MSNILNQGPGSTDLTKAQEALEEVMRSIEATLRGAGRTADYSGGVLIVDQRHRFNIQAKREPMIGMTLINAYDYTSDPPRHLGLEFNAINGKWAHLSGQSAQATIMELIQQRTGS